MTPNKSSCENNKDKVLNKLAQIPRRLTIGSHRLKKPIYSLLFQVHRRGRMSGITGRCCKLPSVIGPKEAGDSLPGRTENPDYSPPGTRFPGPAPWMLHSGTHPRCPKWSQSRPTVPSLNPGKTGEKGGREGDGGVRASERGRTVKKEETTNPPPTPCPLPQSHPPSLADISV